MNGWKTCFNCGGPKGTCGCIEKSNLPYENNINWLNSNIEINDIVSLKDEGNEYTGEIIEFHDRNIQILVRNNFGEYVHEFELDNEIEIKVLFPSKESSFGEEYKIGAIIKNFTEYYKNDVFSDLLLGEIVDVNKDRTEITVKWYNHHFKQINEEIGEIKIPYPYRFYEMIPSVIVTNDEARYPVSYKKGRMIGYREATNEINKNDYNYYEFILETLEDGKSIKVEHLNYDGFYEEIRTFFEHYCMNIYFGNIVMEFIDKDKDSLKSDIMSYLKALNAADDW